MLTVGNERAAQRSMRMMIAGFSARLDFSHHPQVMLKVSAVDAVHEVIHLGI
jgi:hypothetical protein